MEQASSCGSVGTLAAGFPHYLALSALVVGSPEGSGRESRPSTIWAELEEISSFASSSGSAYRRRNTHLFAKGCASQSLFFPQAYTAVHCRARRNKQRLSISCLSPEEDSCSR